jgi:two-component system, OmpR family, sensor histidine kinase TrcS
MMVTSDRDALERIVGNRAEGGNGRTRITVSDRGPGVQQGFVPRLFDPFSRAADSNGKPGTGLGLAIALSYTRRLRGELHYASGRPSGATFTLDLPTS